MCANDGNGGQHCSLISNEQYQQGQHGNNGSLNVPSLNAVGTNGSGNITDGSGNTVGTATYVSNGGFDYHGNQAGFNQLANTSRVVTAASAIYAGAYAGAFVAAGGLAAGGDLLITGLEGDSSAIQFGKTAEQAAHALRHIAEEGLNPQDVQAAIKADIVNNGGVQAGSNTR